MGRRRVNRLQFSQCLCWTPYCTHYYCAFFCRLPGLFVHHTTIPNLIYLQGRISNLRIPPKLHHYQFMIYWATEFSWQYPLILQKYKQRGWYTVVVNWQIFVELMREGCAATFFILMRVKLVIHFAQSKSPTKQEFETYLSSHRAHRHFSNIRKQKHRTKYTLHSRFVWYFFYYPL